MGEKINASDWKTGLTDKCNEVEVSYQAVVDHIATLDNVDVTEIDTDELLAFMQIKLVKMSKALEKMAEG